MLDILKDIDHNNSAFKGETELLEKEKKEYRLLGTFLRRLGLNLYAYDKDKDMIFLVEVEKKNLVSFSQVQEYLKNNKSESKQKYTAFMEANVKSHHIHFEALNDKNAIKRVNKFKQGLIKKLDNLRRPGEGMSPYGTKIK